MRLTRRGRVLIVVLALVTVSGFAYGARGLNAIAIPGIVVLGVSVYQLYDHRRPETARELPRRAQRGETVRVRVTIDSESSLPAHVQEGVGEGLAARGNEWYVTLDRGDLDYDLTLLRRGERSVGPLSIEVRDVFGLLSRIYEYRDGGSFFSGRRSRDGTRRGLLVRPRVYPLAGPAQAAIIGLYGSIGDDRQEFDYLRSYQRGDPLQDIHWKSSAKHPDEDFVVKEFTADEDSDSVTIGAEAREASVDVMADATASIVADLLNAEVEFVLVTPTRRFESEDDDAREQIMDHLAQVGAGSLDADVRDEADLRIVGDAETVWVEIEGRRHRFRELVGGIEEPLPDPTQVDGGAGAAEESAS